MGAFTSTFPLFTAPPRRALVTTHRSIDFDAFASAYGTAIVLHRMNVDAGVALFGAKPPWFDEAYDQMIPEPYRSTIPTRWNELDRNRPIVLVDASDMYRCIDGDVDVRPWCIVDHHNVDPRDVAAEYVVVDADAPACAVVLYDLARAAGIDIDRTLARVWYIGLAGDTVGFAASPANWRTHAYAADLLRIASDAHAVYSRLSRPTVGLCDLIGIGKTITEMETIHANHRQNGYLNVVAFPCYSASEARLLMHMLGSMNLDETIDVVVYVYPNANERSLRLSFRSHNKTAYELAQRTAKELGVEFGGHDNAAGIQRVSDYEPLDLIDVVFDVAHPKEMK